MKRYTYTCDRCGADIPEGERYRMQLADPEDLKKHTYLFEAKYGFDLCTHCAAQLMEYVTGAPISDDDGETAEVQQGTEESADRQQDKDAAVQQDETGEAQEETKDAEVQQVGEVQQDTDKTADGQQAGKRIGRPPVIDHGKVMALHDAGWSNEAIGAEMHLTEKQVRNVVDYESKKSAKCAE